jgi:hypothetical protein
MKRLRVPWGSRCPLSAKARLKEPGLVFRLRESERVDAPEAIAVTRPRDDERMTPRWFLRIGLIVAIIVGLFAASLAAGAAGAFSSAERRVGRDVQNPAKRLEAVGTLADQFATSFADGQPTLPGTRDEQTCPAGYAVRASTLIGALTPARAATTMSAADAQLVHAGWKVDTSRLRTDQPELDASNRRRITIVVAQEVGDQLTTIRVTVTVPCASTTPAPRPLSRSTTTATGGGGGS